MTALRLTGRRRVLVEIDGEPWRAFAEEVVVGAGLVVGQELDRPQLAALARERRRANALAVATRALRHRDLSTQRVSERLAQAGVPVAARGEALERLERAGFVDDERFAHARARSLVERGYGDAAVRAALARERVAGDLVEQALEAVEPERERARRIAHRRGATAATAQHLARRGFADETIEAAVSSFAEIEPQAYD